MAVGVRLESDELGSFDLTEANGVLVRALDLGFPEVRQVVVPRPDGDGELDSTSRIGARAVTITMTVVPAEDGSTREEVLDRVRSYARPDLRPYLVFQVDEGGAERRIRLRGAQAPAVIERPGFVHVAVGWRGPDGVQESAVETVEVADATPAVEAGRTYPLTFPRVYPSSSPLGTVAVENAGNVNVYPRVELWGPCTDPAIENQTVGRALEFVGVSLAEGEFLEVDLRERTVLLNGVTTQSRYDRLDFAASAWWWLVPGENVLRYYPASSDDGSEAVVSFRSAWL